MGWRSRGGVPPALPTELKSVKIEKAAMSKNLVVMIFIRNIFYLVVMIFIKNNH